MLGIPLYIFLALLWLLARWIQKQFLHTPPRWWRSLLIWIGLIALAHVDVPIGYFTQYRPLVKRVGNGVVLQHVVADGFLDPYGSLTLQYTEPELALLQPGYPYGYVEMKADSDRARKSRFAVERTRYVSFSTVDRKNGADCSGWDNLPDSAELRERYTRLAEVCIVARHTREPISRYELRETPVHKLNPGSPFPINGVIHELTDRQTGEPIAQCYLFWYSPLISRLIGAEFVHWKHQPTCLGDGFLELITASIQPRPRDSAPAT